MKAVSLLVLFVCLALLSVSFNVKASSPAYVITDSAVVTSDTTATLFGNITNYGSYNNLTAGFQYGVGSLYITKNDGNSSPPSPPYPNYIQSWSNGDSSAGHDIGGLIVTVDTTAGNTQIAAVTFCVYQAGTGLTITGGFETIVDKISEYAELSCGPEGLHEYLGIRHNGSHATSFEVSFTNSVWAVSFTVSEYANVGTIGTYYTKTQFSATPNITETIPAKSILFSAMTFTGSANTISYDVGHKRIEQLSGAGSGTSVDISNGDYENSDLLNSSSVIIKPHFFSSIGVEFNAIVLTYAYSRHSFNAPIIDLTPCTVYKYRAFVRISPTGSMVAYGSIKTFTTTGVCPSDIFMGTMFNGLILLVFVALVVLFFIAAFWIRRHRGGFSS
jgi:hypothetical protein